MEKKLLVLDLDGTLMNSQKEISSETMKALQRLQQAGHRIVLASGRPTAGIRWIAEALELEKWGGFVLAFNGARIIDWKTKQVIFQQTLDNHYLQRLHEAAVQYGLTILTYRDEYAIAGTDANAYAEFEVRINHMILKPVQNFASYVDFPVNKCLMSGDPVQIKACEDELVPELGSVLSIFKSEDFFLEIMANDVDKGASLDRLVKTLGMTKQQVVCCGDGYNDIPMIQYAGVGVAMSNAKDVVKEAADEVTGSNDEDGLIPIIEKYFLK